MNRELYPKAANEFDILALGVYIDVDEGQSDDKLIERTQPVK
jgi:hypothetical protein